MPVSLPYLPSNKNIPVLFEKISSAKVPDRFSQNFLQTTLGLKSTNDRPLIPLLRTLGFLDQSGAPTSAYRLLKGHDQKDAIAAGVRRAYASLFDAQDNANSLPSEKLKSLVAQVAGTDDTMTARIASTFTALAKLGNFDARESVDSETKVEKADDVEKVATNAGNKSLRTEFHYNIQVHLPSNGTEEVYLNIFNALRKTFQ